MTVCAPTKPIDTKVIADHRLEHGDTLDFLSRLGPGSVDVLITDPPYSEHTQANIYGSVDVTKGQTVAERKIDLGFDFLQPELRRACAEHYWRIVRRWLLIFSDEEGTQPWRDDLRRVGFEIIRTGIWVKVSPRPQITGDRPAAGHEPFILAHRPEIKKRWNGGGRPAVYEYPAREPSERERLHPTQKPLGLLQALIRDYTDPGELVLDNFAGVASTGVAALREGRRFVGVEAMEEHHTNAQRRLRDVRHQPALF